MYSSGLKIPDEKRNYGVWEIEYIRHKNIVYVRSSGLMDNSHFKQMIFDSLTEAAKSNANKFLIDHRKIIPRLSTLAILEFSINLANIGIRHINKVAILYPDQLCWKKYFRFFETASRNRGLNVQLFTESDKAITWLTS